MACAQCAEATPSFVCDGCGAAYGSNDNAASSQQTSGAGRITGRPAIRYRENENPRYLAAFLEARCAGPATRA
jgi:hypothetical protein